MPWMLFILFADDPVKPATDLLAGGAGWVGTGLLGSVLAWLLWAHLPAKDKQLKELIDGKDRQVKELLESLETRAANKDASHSEMVSGIVKAWIDGDKERRTDYKENLKIVIDHCQRENATRDGVMMKVIDEVTQAVLDLRQYLEDARTPKET